MKYSNEVKELKLEVLSLVSRFAFEGSLEENIHRIPKILIPGNEANFRCCVYKEREILRERAMLAANRPSKPPKGAVSVLTAACEGCPINRFNVTANCQRCMAKSCMNACKFDAITMSVHSAHIDHSKCKECGKCAEACPYNAISDTMRPCMRSCPVDAISFDENKQVKIKYDDCINCGACVSDCPFGALSDSSMIVDIIENIRAGKKVIALLAPAIEGQFSSVTVGSIKSAVKELGFADAVEVALGADAVAIYEAEELIKNKAAGVKMTTSCCPSFLSLIHKHFPKLKPNISSTASPMAATARLVRHDNPGIVTVFVGPCIAKKFEMYVSGDTADYVITFDELNAMFDSRDIDPADFDEVSQDGSIYGKGYAVTGGVASAVIKAANEKGSQEDISCNRCTGTKECKKALALMNSGRMQEDIIEGMICNGGCVHGPSSLLDYNEVIKNRKVLTKQADNRGISDNIKGRNFDKIDMKRKYRG